ncbi:Brefeldin A-inhibited guanine nucleotide-exchange protein 2 [Auxenochlorella protothecoides]|uniref:Brefeldin A-inhibited guanine nucleotide-exchange protein 2 n=2 Tax=Auxenochlorella protothecoides TaxID=3075 RepID=A0A087SD58_AUXPR|nr:Brefeldin A-inhibited guanine nucleotide-exchange protein 2 [Auxenochlorella protothecoides]KFM23662.1 Brefeldin A-inhibited guanine nucleotide-exchange protein 2 [Auxenochlorella protothecoides]
MTSPASLVRPCLERIAQNATARKQAGLRQDVLALLEELDSALPLQPAQPPEQQRAASPTPEAPPARPPRGAAPGVHAGLAEDPESGAFRLTLRLEDDDDGGGEEGGEDGEVPLAEEAGRQMTPRQRGGEHHPGALTDEAALRLLEVLAAAVDSRRFVLVEAALDAVQRLIAHAYIRGTVTVLHHRAGGGAGPLDHGAGGEGATAGTSTSASTPSPGSEVRRPLPPAALAVDLIVRCDDLGDEGVELRLLSALLTAVTSAGLAVHGAALLLCVRAGYNVYLLSRSEVNAATAKATLTQALNVCFARMESGDAHEVPPPIMVADVLGMPPAETSSLSASVQQFLTDVVASVDPFGTHARGVQQSLDAVFAAPAGPGSGGARSPTAAGSTPASPAGAWGAGGAAADPGVGPPAPPAVEEPVDEPGDRDGIQWREPASPLAPLALAGEASAASTGGAVPGAGDPNVALALQRSAYLVFRALCKLSIRSVDGGGGTDATTARGKVLALELLKIVLENSGPVFATSERFMGAIRQYLCLSLLKNCASSVPAALPPCASIFLTLLTRFRAALKGEVGVFYPMILLRPIEPVGAGVLAHTTGSVGGAAPVDVAYRGVALACLARLAADGQALMDLYVNYDCDLEGANLFERTVAALVRLAQGSPGLEAAVPAPAEERALRFEALRCLLTGSTLEGWKAFKRVFQEGVELFNAKPAKGVAFMQEQGLVGPDPDDVAQFLAKTLSLSKAQVGDYLGERDPFNLKVMHAYVDALDFAGLEFDMAIRKFLDGFRLPGEAQKIDRLMEKFAERYVLCNPDSFRSADVAYVLAYSVIMLNTDAHNPGVKVKMTRADFLRNNRGINDGGDLPEAFMSGLYDAIRAAALEPSDEALARWHDALRARAAGATFHETHDPAAVAGALAVAWAPLLGALSTVFEESEDPRWVVLCLAGLVAASGLACALGAATLRDAFVASLARFTMLHSPGALRLKHAQAFRALLVVAEHNGDALGPCWQDVLRCVSRFELLQTATAGVPSDALLFAWGRAGRTPCAAVPGGGRDALPPAEVMRSVDPDDLDRIFVHSSRLNSDAIVEFVTTLCTIAREELRPVDAPRVFSLTKIVEIAAHNMDRIRLVWARIWAVLSDFFVEVGCAPNLQVAMYGVDSLRQLATKFLERDELANYTFQSDFLRPFCVVMRRSKAPEIRELVIRCVSQMVLARVANVKSGWKSVFMVFTTAAADESPQIVRLAFDTVEKIVREHFHYITETEAATFTDCVNCLIAYTNNPHSLDVALNSIAFLRFCALQLAAGGIGDVEKLPEGASNHTTSATVGSLRFTDKEQHMYYWFPLLAGLSELTFDPRPQVRTSALDVLFDTLRFHGGSFTPAFWLRVFDSVLLPIFDVVRAEITDTTTFTDERRRAEADRWLYATCTRTLQYIVDLVAQYHAGVEPLLARLLHLLLGFATRPHAELAAVGVAALSRLTLALAPRLDEPGWRALLDAYAEAARETLPDRYEGAGAGEEGATLAPLATATLTSLRGFDDDAFRAHVHDLFPRLVALIAAEGAPPELRRALSDLFLHRVGAMLV